MKNLLLMLSLFGFLAFTTSCGDDDGPSCDEDDIFDKIENLDDALYEACTENPDCDDCQDALDNFREYAESIEGCIEDEEGEELFDYYEDYFDSVQEQIDDEC